MASEDTSRVVILSETTRFGAETGAGVMRNRCAFTSRDMAEGWADAFTYAITLGWGGDGGTDAWDEVAAEQGWDADLVAFLKDAHERFRALADRKTNEGN